MAFVSESTTRAVRALGERLVAWLEADSALQDRTRTALVAAVRERWSWQGVARGVIAAAARRTGRPVLWVELTR